MYSDIHTYILAFIYTFTYTDINTDILRSFHPTAVECTFFLSAHRTFSSISDILGHKTALHKYKRTEIVPCIFSDHNNEHLLILSLSPSLSKRNTNITKTFSSPPSKKEKKRIINLVGQWVMDENHTQTIEFHNKYVDNGFDRKWCTKRTDTIEMFSARKYYYRGKPWKKSMVGGTRRWLSQFSVQLQLMSHDLTVCGFQPHIELCVDSWEPGACFGFCVSLSVCSPAPPPPC